MKQSEIPSNIHKWNKALSLSLYFHLVSPTGEKEIASYKPLHTRWCDDDDYMGHLTKSHICHNKLNVQYYATILATKYNLDSVGADRLSLTSMIR
jgi:hypothetical protein